MQLRYMAGNIGPGIETYKQNYTRFLVVGNERKEIPEEIKYQYVSLPVITRVTRESSC